MKPFAQQTYYELLEVPVTASAGDIEAAYKRLMELYAPDSIAVYALAESDVESLRARMSEAFEILGDVDLRAEYDKDLGVSVQRAASAPVSETKTVPVTLEPVAAEVAPVVASTAEPVSETKTVPVASEPVEEPRVETASAAVQGAEPVSETKTVPVVSERTSEPPPAPEGSSTSVSASDAFRATFSRGLSFAYVSSSLSGSMFVAPESATTSADTATNLTKAATPEGGAASPAQEAAANLAKATAPVTESSPGSAPVEVADVASPAEVPTASPSPIAESAPAPTSEVASRTVPAEVAEAASAATVDSASRTVPVEATEATSQPAPGVEAAGSAVPVESSDSARPPVAEPAVTKVSDAPSTSVTATPPPADSAPPAPEPAVAAAAPSEPQPAPVPPTSPGIPSPRATPVSQSTPASRAPPPPLAGRGGGTVRAPVVSTSPRTTPNPATSAPPPSTAGTPRPAARPASGRQLGDAQVMAQDSAIATAEAALAQVAARVREARPRPIDIPPDAEFNGELLRRVREAKGIPLRQLAERTRISSRHLENVEADQYSALPAAVYLRGIIMNVARELGLDPLRVSRSYLALVSDKASKK